MSLSTTHRSVSFSRRPHNFEYRTFNVNVNIVAHLLYTVADLSAPLKLRIKKFQCQCQYHSRPITYRSGSFSRRHYNFKCRIVYANVNIIEDLIHTVKDLFLGAIINSNIELSMLMSTSQQTYYIP